MSPPVTESPAAPVRLEDARSWSVGRWLLALALVFGLHVAFFYFLNQLDRPKVRPRGAVVGLRFQSGLRLREELENPTLFALPHPHGFAGATWLQRPVVEFIPFRWSEPLRLLPLPVRGLGATFLQLAETNQPASRRISLMPPAVTTVLPLPEVPAVRSQTELRLTGGLANRALREPRYALPLAGQSGLTNTVIHALVNARGQVVSSLILPPGSGSKADDAAALRAARNLWFRAAPDSAAVDGWLIFEWGAAVTNATSSGPR
jgi:hypothetical protein